MNMYTRQTSEPLTA